MEYSIEEELEEQMKINKNLQQRIDKSIKYLNNVKNEYATQMVMLNPDDLLSILQDEEVK